ncbi:MAG: DUF4124 domain-containing protein [Betaproteobacteria bacterium]|nr:DUF4124 domain-containing protein [Betaproteobacteria bacterium]
MRRLLLILALAAAPALAFAQTYKCKDALGRTQYTNQPGPGCTDIGGKPVEAARPAAPAPAAKTKQAAKPTAAKPAAKAKSAPKPAAKREAAIGALPADPARRKIDCRALQQQHDWLMSPAGRKVEMHSARVSQVQQAMRGCK